MPLDRWPRPLYIDSDGNPESPGRIPFNVPPFSEEELQERLRTHPDLLPLESFDPLFSPAICIGREVAVRAGRIDNLYVSSSGYLTLVETKLWKSPQARREVIAQVIDYARTLSGWTYEDVEQCYDTYRTAMGIELPTLFEYVQEAINDGIDEQEFVDSVSRCLAGARVLLLVVGEGIREGVEEMASFLQTTPHLQYTLGLVEIACYRFDDGGLLLVPHIVSRTSEVTRAIVRVELKEGVEKVVRVETEIPKPPKRGRDPVNTLSKEEFFAELARSTSSDAAGRLREFCDGLLEIGGLHEHFTKHMLVIKLEVPGIPGNPDWVLSFSKTGDVASHGGPEGLAKRGELPMKIADDFFDRLSLISPKMPPLRRKKGKVPVRKGDTHGTLVDLLPELPRIRKAIEQLIRDFEGQMIH